MGFFGWLWWTALPIRKAEAVAAYRLAFPERDPGELRRMIDELVAGYWDLLLGRRARLEGTEQLAGGGICLVGHGGAWDLALISAAQRVPVTIFVKPPANRLAAWLIRRLRRGDLELLPPRDSMAAAYAALAAGRVVAFVLDQRHNAGVAVPFFGRPARTSAAFAAMAWRSRAPLFGAWQARGDDGRHHLWVERLDVDVPEDRDEAIAALTLESQRFYERQIRQRPWSWLWLHRRWR